jgi:hypothetical protein
MGVDIRNLELSRQNAVLQSERDLLRHWLSREAAGPAWQDKSSRWAIGTDGPVIKIGPNAARPCRRLNRRGAGRDQAAGRKFAMFDWLIALLIVVLLLIKILDYLDLLDLVAAAVDLLVGTAMLMGRLAIHLMRRAGKLLGAQRG